MDWIVIVGGIVLLVMGVSAYNINKEIIAAPKEPVEPTKPKETTKESKKLKPDNPNLIFCPDCYKEVSKNAKTCIHCGCDLTLGHNKTTQSLNKAGRGMMKAGCSMIILQAAIFWLILFFIILYALA